MCLGKHVFLIRQDDWAITYLIAFEFLSTATERWVTVIAIYDLYGHFMLNSYYF